MANMIRLIITAISLTLSTNGFADTPTIASTLHLTAPLIAGRASADGKMFVTLLQEKDKQSATLQIIDISDVQHPTRVGSLPFSYGEWSLSDDGNTVLLHTPTEKEEYNKETRHEIVMIDLSDASHPKELWRRAMLARKFIISASANAYAYSKLSATKKGMWETTVEFVTVERPLVTIEEPEFSDGKMQFSPHADFIVHNSFLRQLYEWDLRSKTPKAYQQEFSSFPRYSCLPAVLDAGYVVAKDTRISRFGIYEPSEGIPRISTLAHDGSNSEYGQYCNSLNVTSTDNKYVYRDGHGRLLQIDLNNLKSPNISKRWQLPSDINPLAVAQNILISVTRNSEPDLRFYRLDIEHSEPFAWQALEKAYESIMVTYNAAVSAGKPIPYFDATLNFEEAGILNAVDAPIEKISTQKASAILNDYGFLAIKRGISPYLIEHILKRAIELNPHRSLAHLNLADFFREQISVYGAKGKDVNVLRKEIEEHYRMYLSLGGKLTPSIDAFLKGDQILQTKNSDICEAIAAYANAGRLSELVSGVGTNLPFEGKRIDLAFTTEGTAHVPVLYGFDATTDFPLKDSDMPSPPSGTEDAWVGDELGLLTYRNENHILFYKDLQHPSSSTPLTDGLACLFTTDTLEKIGPNSTERDLCVSLQNGMGPLPYVFDGTSPMNRAQVSTKWGESEIRGTHVLDITNNGMPANIAEIEMSSGAGAGCDELFYEIVNADGTEFVGGPQREMLMQLQHAMPTDRYPILPCGNKPTFFSYKNRLYFETKPANWPPVDKWNQYHRVTTIINDKVQEVCDFQFETTVKGH